MAEFRYNALDRNGGKTSGLVSADSRQAAIVSLAGRGVFVTLIASRDEHARGERTSFLSWPRRKAISLRHKTAMLQQMATALKAGLPLLQALRVVEEQAETAAMRRVVHDLAGRVQSGESLSLAMEHCGGGFSRLEMSMVRVGETAGLLDQVMGYLADFAERDIEVREKVRSAATYPIFVMGLAAISVVIVMTVILPRILATVSENVRVLPAPTLILMACSSLLKSYGLVVLAAMIAGIFLLRRWLRRPGGRLAFDRFLLKVPTLGTALRRVAVGRFARTLGTLSKSGIGILESLRVLRDTLGNEALATELDKVAARITQGQSIAEPLRETGQFPPLMIQVIAMGERTGRLDELLLQAAEAYEKETAAAIGRVMTVLPAVFIVLLALVVAFILVAVLLPIVNMETTVPGV